MDIKQALKMYEDYQSGWSDIYKRAKDDLEFYIGKDDAQWNDTALKARRDLGRPCLTVNVLPQFVHQVTNQIRQNTPSINVLPGDMEASEKTAKVLKGLIRKIEYSSGADEVYDTAAQYAVTASIGFIRVDHDYTRGDSFEQEIRIKRVQNPLTVWIDPSSIECDGEDSNGAILLDTITKAEFKKRYKGKPFVSFESNPAADDKRESITLAEIFVKEYEVSEKYIDEDGTIGEAAAEDKRKTRKTRKPIIRRYLYSGHGILENTIFPGEYIPVIPVYGQEIWVDGKRNLVSLIRNAKDPQRRYNHWASIEAEILDKSPLAPWMAAFGVTEDSDKDWSDPDNAVVLRYNTQDINGNPAKPPERVALTGVPSGIINAMQGAYEDIKRAMGLYDASVGQKSNETSGIAIEARQEQGSVATFHFPDNLSRSIAQVGRVVVGMIPTIYDTARIIQTIDGEDNPQFVGINGEMTEEQKDQHDFLKGIYDVRVVTGPSYASLKQETTAKLGEIIGAQPQMMGVFGDIWAKNLDIPDAEALAERIKKTLPPQLIEGEGEEEAPTPRELQMAQQLEVLQQQLQQLAPVAEGKQAEMAMKGQELEGNQAAKQAELTLKQQEMQMKYETESRKLENERIKLQLEAEKLQLEREKMMIPAQPVTEQPTGMKLDTTGFQFMRTPEEEARMAAEAEAKLAKEEEERMKEDAKEVREQEIQLAVLQMLGSISTNLASLADGVNNPRPMQVVRDENGMITGSAPVTIN